jgi:hypothetical protein
MGNGAPQIVMSKDLEKAVNEVKSQVRMHVMLGEKWRDFRKPLGAMHAPGIPPTPAMLPIPGMSSSHGIPPFGLIVKGVNMAAGMAGHAFGTQGSKGRALRENANLAGKVQHTITGLTQTISALPEPQRSINLSYLQHLADATIVAGRACQELCQGNSPAKDVTRLAASWVVTLGCSTVGLPLKMNQPAALLDQRVKDAAVDAYPLFSAGKKLNETVDPAEAVHIAFVALDVA